MKLEDRSAVLVDEVRTAFELAKGDVLTDAEGRAPVRTGRYRQSLEVTETVDTNGRLGARLGSPLSSARAKEKGAYIEAKQWPTLVFRVGGSWRRPKFVRIPARPTVVPAGRRFPELMTARLRELRGRP